MAKSTTNILFVPLGDASYLFIAVVLTVLIIVGSIGNGICLYIFAKYRQLRTAQNIFIISLNMCDLSLSLIVSPMATASAYARGWVWGDAGCDFGAFMAYSTGMTSLFIHMATAIDRSIAITKPSQKSTKKKAIVRCALCFVFGILWATLPFMGWNAFVLEDSKIECSLNWTATDDLSTSYIYVTGVIGFLIPSIVMIIAYAGITKKLRRIRSSTIVKNRESVALRTLAIEKRTIVTGVLIMSSFWFCWLPYMIISFLSAFGYRREFPVFLVSTAPIFAKCQASFDAIILLTRHRELRKIASKLGPCKFFRHRVCGRCKKRGSLEVDPSSPFNTLRYLASRPNSGVANSKADMKHLDDSDKPSIPNTHATDAGISPIYVASD